MAPIQLRDIDSWLHYHNGKGLPYLKLLILKYFVIHTHSFVSVQNFTIYGLNCCTVHLFINKAMIDHVSSGHGSQFKWLFQEVQHLYHRSFATFVFLSSVQFFALRCTWFLLYSIFHTKNTASNVMAFTSGIIMLLYATVLLVWAIIGERAKRARRYLVMFMETRDIYIYICTSVSNTHARVSVLRIKFKS